MAHDLAEELRQVQEDVRLLRAELTALARLVEESIVFQTLVALDTGRESCERAASVARILRMLAAMHTVR
jgi:hypothetical protein